MAVTDLTDSLPYWARQGVGYGGGPGPTGGPGAAPQGAGNSASWLQYLMQMFGPISSANAATVDLGHGDGDNPPVSPVAAPPAPAGPSILPQARGVAVPPGPMANGPAPAGPSILPQARGVAVQPGPMEPGSTTMAPAAAAPGAANPLATAGPGAAGPVPGPLASGGASGAGATSNPRFVQLDQGQNMDPTARNRGPQMTALNLAGLFGGGGAPGAPRGVNPANLPAPAAQTVSGPLARGAPSGDNWDIDANGNVVPNYGDLSTTSNAPWKYGPLQKGNIWKTSGGPHR
jgi:collagen type III alpha